MDKTFINVRAIVKDISRFFMYWYSFTICYLKMQCGYDFQFSSMFSSIIFNSISGSIILFQFLTYSLLAYKYFNWYYIVLEILQIWILKFDSCKGNKRKMLLGNFEKKGKVFILYIIRRSEKWFKCSKTKSKRKDFF